MHELISQNKIVLSKDFSVGSVFIIEMLSDMYAVLGFTSLEEEPVYSRAFFFNEKNKKNVLKKARECFYDVKQCFTEKKLEQLDSLDW